MHEPLGNGVDADEGRLGASGRSEQMARRAAEIDDHWPLAERLGLGLGSRRTGQHVDEVRPARLLVQLLELARPLHSSPPEGER